MLVFLLFFILQLAKINIVAGSLTGSVAFSYIRFLDPFAYLESLLASRDLVAHALWSVMLVVMLYLILGRAFCGWLCPMDYAFGLMNSIRSSFKSRFKNNVEGTVPETHKKGIYQWLSYKKTGYLLALLFLLTSAMLGVPFFTNYMSHLTNLYRGITAGYFALSSLPVDIDLIVYSLSALTLLIVLESLYPRLWCRGLCPVGRTYGLFNKLSLLRLTSKKDTCIHCEACDKECYMGVDVSRHTEQAAIRDTNCILCGRCIEACAQKGKTLKLTFRR